MKAASGTNLFEFIGSSSRDIHRVWTVWTVLHCVPQPDSRWQPFHPATLPRNRELRDRLRRVLMHVHRGIWHIRTPSHMIRLGKPKHQVGIRIAEFGTDVLLLGHHVAHRAMLRHGQFFLVSLKIR
jgi:hypothetical protein